MSFQQLGLSPEICRAVAKLGYSQPTPIQLQAIPVILQGRDMLAGAQTGTGKTAVFALPMLQRLSRDDRKPQAPRKPRALVAISLLCPHEQGLLHDIQRQLACEIKTASVPGFEVTEARCASDRPRHAVRNAPSHGACGMSRRPMTDAVAQPRDSRTSHARQPRSISQAHGRFSERAPQMRRTEHYEDGDWLAHIL